MAKLFKLELPNQLFIELICADTKLSEFIQRQYKSYISSTNEIRTNSFVKISGAKNSIEYINNVQLSRSIAMKNGLFAFVKPSKSQVLNYKFQFTDKYEILIDFKKKPLYYLKNMMKSSYSINHILFYQTVLYPIFSLYSILGNYHNVHGSLLKIDDKYIVLTGLDGVGKSSLTTELALLGHKVLADNFLLFNGEDFIALNMPIRLELENQINTNVIYQDDNLKEVLFDDVVMESIKANNVYFLSITETLEIKEIDSDLAYINWNLINNGAGEILDANLFCMPFLYQNILNGFKAKRDKTIKFYSLGIPKGKIKEGVNEVLCQLDI